jgi:hypothetical protein
VRRFAAVHKIPCANQGEADINGVAASDVSVENDPQAGIGRVEILHCGGSVAVLRSANLPR